jgi:hypothetical protein
MNSYQFLIFLKFTHHQCFINAIAQLLKHLQVQSHNSQMPSPRKLE